MSSSADGTDTLRNDDIESEQAYLTALYTRLDELRVQAAERLRAGDFGFMGGAVSSAEVTALLP